MAEVRLVDIVGFVGYNQYTWMPDRSKKLSAVRDVHLSFSGVEAPVQTFVAVYGECVGSLDRRKGKANEAIRNTVAGL
jgi:hypothetical protein